MRPFRRTKIIATLGPSTDVEGILEKLIYHGVNVLRANFSHGKTSDHQRRIEHARQIAETSGRSIAILADLQGPKIRIGRFKKSPITLQVNQLFTLDAALDDDAGDETQVGIDYKALPNDVKCGDDLLLDDGRIVLRVEAVKGTKIQTQVVIGGALTNNKGINRRGGGLTAKALTDKDRTDLKAAVRCGVDYIALSFPRNAADIMEAKALLAAENANVGVIAKIERAEALDNLLEIIKASDGLMVARGDLGVEIGDPQLPAAQNRIIHEARRLNKPVIVATQMMESMIHNTCPTRAEVFDVANAVLTNTDAVMLSAETATGAHPVTVIDAMAGICLGAEKTPETQLSKHRVECHFERIDEAVAMATMYAANHVNLKAIVCLTESGYTPLLMSRIRTGIPIYALSRHEATCRKMALYLGVHPIHFNMTAYPENEINHQVIRKCQNLGLLQDKDWVIITRGDFIGVHGQTNAMKIVEVGNVV